MSFLEVQDTLHGKIVVILTMISHSSTCNLLAVFIFKNIVYVL